MKLSIETVLERIEKYCIANNFTFLCLCDSKGENCEYYGGLTHVKLQCNICGTIWYGQTCNRLKKKFCPTCSRKNMFTKSDAEIKQLISNVQKQCFKKHYTFLGFCDEKGEMCDFKNQRDTYVKLKCNICGYVWNSTNYDNFVRKGNGCPECGKQRRYTQEEAVDYIRNLCKKLDLSFLGFCNKDGSECQYDGKKTHLRLKCNKCNSEWNSTTFWGLCHNVKSCSNCKIWCLEDEMKTQLGNAKEFFIFQKKFDWLGKQSLDFYIPKYKVAIECQGRQHFGLGGWHEPFEVIQERDERKRRLCQENGIRLLYYSNLGIDYPYKVYEDFDELLKEIKGEGS